jgi:predicted methyltransferase
VRKRRPRGLRGFTIALPLGDKRRVGSGSRAEEIEMRRVLRLSVVLTLSLLPAVLRADESGEADRLAALLGVTAGSRVAEIGAGDGLMAAEIARRVGASGRVYATELEAEQRDEIAASARDAGLANVEVLAAQLAATGLPDRCCDAVFMRNVYHHLTEPAAIAADIQSALVPGGMLVVIDFPPTWFLAPFSPEGVGEERTGHGITIEAALRELRGAGFVHVETIASWSSRWLGPDVYALVLRAPAD